MKVTNRIADLRRFFPFSRCETTLRTKALSLGKCVKYESGESLLFSGSPAKHCGLILEGQAVAFKIDSSGRRYQLCLGEGCFVGLETLEEDSTYTAKITALSDLEVLFWNADGLKQLCDASPEFYSGIQMLNDGRVYQEQWLIPETDVTDPVLSSVRAHWLSIAAPAFLIIPALLICLGACGMLIRRYIAAWLLVFGLLAAAGTLLYKLLTSRANERLILTTSNLIHVPADSEAEMNVARLSGLESVSVVQNVLERLFLAGRISYVTDTQKFTTPLLHDPVLLAELIHDFAERASLGRPIPLRTGGSEPVKVPLTNTGGGASGPAGVPVAPETPEMGSLPPFKTIEFHAHWALLVKMIMKPLLCILVSFYAMHYFRNNPYVYQIRRVLLVIAVIAAAGVVYQILAWKNHRFIIEEDCVKDYSKKPFSAEDLNMAMNHKIQSVRFEKQGFFQMLLDYGTVYILAGEGELSFDYVGQPQKVQQLINDTCARFENKRQMEEEARRRVYITDLVNEIQRETNPNPDRTDLSQEEN